MSKRRGDKVEMARISTRLRPGAFLCRCQSAPFVLTGVLGLSFTLSRGRVASLRPWWLSPPGIHSHDSAGRRVLGGRPPHSPPTYPIAIVATDRARDSVVDV
jgi:hypothetical protein